MVAYIHVHVICMNMCACMYIVYRWRSCAACISPTVTVLQGDAVDESIVYVSEPQPLAHTSEEVIDMVENPVTSDVQVHNVCCLLWFNYSLPVLCSKCITLGVVTLPSQLTVISRHPSLEVLIAL